VTAAISCAPLIYLVVMLLIQAVKAR
jgi:hypothetical protein